MWTQFSDMSSGGRSKLEWSSIFIELAEGDAIEYFKSTFNRDPNNITCECCGEDYAITEHDDENVPSTVTKDSLIIKIPRMNTRIGIMPLKQPSKNMVVEVYERARNRLIKLD
jgi:hypothetical protein